MGGRRLIAEFHHELIDLVYDAGLSWTSACRRSGRKRRMPFAGLVHVAIAQLSIHEAPFPRPQIAHDFWHTKDIPQLV